MEICLDCKVTAWAYCDSASAAGLNKRGVRRTLLTWFSFNQPPFITCSPIDAAAVLTVVTQGDFFFPLTALRAAGIRRHLWVWGCWLLALRPYPPVFWCQSIWDLTRKLWLARLSGLLKESAAVVFTTHHVLTGRQESHFSVFTSPRLIFGGRSGVLLISRTCFE